MVAQAERNDMNFPSAATFLEIKMLYHSMAARIAWLSGI